MQAAHSVNNSEITREVCSAEAGCVQDRPRADRPEVHEEMVEGRAGLEIDRDRGCWRSPREGRSPAVAQLHMPGSLPDSSSDAS